MTVLLSPVIPSEILRLWDKGQWKNLVVWKHNAARSDDGCFSKMHKHALPHTLPLLFPSVTKSNVSNECSVLSSCSYVLSVCPFRLVNPLPLRAACMLWSISIRLCVLCLYVCSEIQNLIFPQCTISPLSSHTFSTNKVDLTVADYSNEDSPREYAHSHCTSN